MPLKIIKFVSDLKFHLCQLSQDIIKQKLKLSSTPCIVEVFFVTNFQLYLQITGFRVQTETVSS